MGKQNQATLDANVMQAVILKGSPIASLMITELSRKNFSTVLAACGVTLLAFAAITEIGASMTAEQAKKVELGNVMNDLSSIVQGALNGKQPPPEHGH